MFESTVFGRLSNGTGNRPSHSETACMLLQVSVGRLGVITQLSLSIAPQQAVQRAEQDMTAAQFAQQVKQVQDAYTQAKQTGSSEAIWTALHSLNETQVEGAWLCYCRACSVPFMSQFPLKSQRVHCAFGKTQINHSAA